MRFRGNSGRKKGSAEERDCEGLVRHGLLSNVSYFYRFMFHYRKSSLGQFPVYIIFTVLQSAVSVVIPSVAVHSIEAGFSMGHFFLRVGGIILLYGAICAVQNIAWEEYATSIIVTRVNGGISCFVDKGLSMDYVNRESWKNQKLFQGAVDSMSSNTVGMEMIYRQIPLLFISVIGLVLYGGAIFTVDIRILFVLFLMFVFNIWLNSRARDYLNRTMEENNAIQRRKYYMSDRAYNLECGKDVRLFHMERWFGELAKSYVESGMRWQKRIEKRFYLPVASDTIFAALRDCVAYVILIREVFRGTMPVAVFVLMIGIVSGFSDWMFGALNSYNDLKKASLQSDYFRSVLEMKDSFLHEGGRPAPEREKCPPDIVLEDLSFSYEYEEDGQEKSREILSHINLCIRPGEKIALVGNNGAGKTTLVKLLCGFYHPTGGRILVDGIPVEEYNIEEYFRLFGVVFQDMDSMAFTIRANVTGKGREDSDMERFWMAVEQAGLKEKILSLEKKEETYLTQVFDDEGIRLSGGELQKLMLARCIYKDAPVLVLDEPTAALDPIAESEMYQHYSELAHGKSGIFISHRLASTRFCDRILFLENGGIAEEGTHEELIALGGRYAKIFEIQSHYYREDGQADTSVDMEAAYE